jgi:hypothetical protein
MSFAPDPRDVQLEADTWADEVHARKRGARVQLLTEALISELLAGGDTPLDLDNLRARFFHRIADDLFGNQAVEIPNLEKSPPAVPVSALRALLIEGDEKLSAAHIVRGLAALCDAAEGKP